MNIRLNSDLFGCRWRQCISRCVYQLTLVPYPYSGYSLEKLQNKRTIKHLATAVCPNVRNEEINIINPLKPELNPI